MANLYNFVSHVTTVTLVFIVLLILKLVNLLRLVTGGLTKSNQTNNRTDQYLSLIEAQNPTSHYDGQSTAECAVCLSEILIGESVRELNCTHVFHKNCLDEWLQQYVRSTCPLCRTEILADETVAYYQRLQYQHLIDNDHWSWSYEDNFLLSFLLHGNSLHGLGF